MRRKFNTDYTNKVLNALAGIKMQFPNGISSSELKERLTRFGIACYSNIISGYIKRHVLTKIGGGPKTKYLIHTELENIVAAHEDISAINKNVTQTKPVKHNWKKKNEPSQNLSEIDKAIELLEKSGYFVRKIRKGVTIEFKEIISQ